MNNFKGILSVTILILVFTVSCKSTMATGPYVGLSEKNYTKVSDATVTGKSCRTHIFFVPIGKYDLGYAFSDAMSRAPAGTQGLSNVDISYSYPALGGFLFGQYCFHVTGTPARRI